MATFQEMRDLVIGFTKRPELVSLTDSAIKMATLRAHSVDLFPRDLTSAVLSYPVPASTQIFVDIENIYTAVPTLRVPKFLQSEDILTLLPSAQFEYVTSPELLWDEYNILKPYAFTLYGETLRARSTGATGRYRLWFYKKPITAVDTYSSWIANEHPEEVAMWAAGIVWARSGNTEQATITQRDHVLPFKADLVTNYLSSAK